jgi:hypothetical protein
VRTAANGSTFSLRLPGFSAARAPAPELIPSAPPLV